MIFVFEASNRLLQAYQNISNLAQLLGKDFGDVKAVYDAKGGSVVLTTIAILEKHAVSNSAILREEHGHRVKYLTSRHSDVPPKLVQAAVDMTDDQPQLAEELLDMLSPHYKELLRQRLASNVTLAPIQDELDSYSVISNTRRTQPPSLGSLRPSSGTARDLSMSSVQDRLANANLRLENSQASLREAHRKGASNPLFRQVGPVYAEASQRAAAEARAAASQKADLLAAQQKTAGQIDLHNMLVEDGVRIARERVRAWWDALGEGRSQKARAGFVVITGQGRHSEGGVSPMRQRVFKALRADGWRFEVHTGTYVVTGRT